MTKKKTTVPHKPKRKFHDELKEAAIECENQRIKELRVQSERPIQTNKLVANFKQAKGFIPPNLIPSSLSIPPISPSLLTTPLRSSSLNTPSSNISSLGQSPMTEPSLVTTERTEKDVLEETKQLTGMFLPYFDTVSTESLPTPSPIINSHTTSFMLNELLKSPTFTGNRKLSQKIENVPGQEQPISTFPFPIETIPSEDNDNIALNEVKNLFAHNESENLEVVKAAVESQIEQQQFANLQKPFSP